MNELGELGDELGEEENLCLQMSIDAIATQKHNTNAFIYIT